jgi:hypothetical protein
MSWRVEKQSSLPGLAPALAVGAGMSSQIIDSSPEKAAGLRCFRGSMLFEPATPRGGVHLNQAHDPGGASAVILMSVWRACWQQERSALDRLTQLPRGTPVALALPP